MADIPPSRSARPSLIPGVYNYCDTRCPRCPFNRRCLVYLQQERVMSDDPVGDVLNEYGPLEKPPPEFLEIVSRAEEEARRMTPEESAALTRENEARHTEVNADRLVVASRYYAITAWRVTQAFGPIADERGDPVVIGAVETIAALAAIIASKTYRALSGALDEDFDRFDLENDANGSAKVARLIIEDSRQAWRVLMEIGRAAADGVPASMVRVLDEIDAGLAQRFPSAMSFVRPGFDTEGVVS